MDENNEELKVLFKVLEKDGKITVNDINKLTRKLENVGKPPEKPQKYKKDDSEENDKDNSIGTKNAKTPPQSASLEPKAHPKPNLTSKKITTRTKETN